MLKATSTATGDDGELAIFRASLSRFLADEMAPNADKWRQNRIVDRGAWRMLGSMGMLGAGIPEEYGGSGGDIRHEAILLEETERHLPEIGPSLAVHSTIVSHYLLSCGTEEQKLRWLPKLASGEVIGAIALTEPDAGSDLRGMRTSAALVDGRYRIRGQKTYITNGQSADLIIVACKTGGGGSDISLLLVETANAAGFQRGRHLDKIGLEASDTSELFFDDVEVSPESILGGVLGHGFHQLMAQLPRERIAIAIAAVAAIEKAVEITTAYAKDRKAFGKRLIDNQHIAFELADLKTEAFVARAMLNHCLALAVGNDLDTLIASMAKYWSTEKLGRVVDRCLQIHGGNGFMKEYEIARMFVDARALRIYGGTSEIMQLIIARSMA